jgi:hypothetical protein
VLRPTVDDAGRLQHSKYDFQGEFTSRRTWLRIDELAAWWAIHAKMEPEGSQYFPEHDLVRWSIHARSGRVRQDVCSVIGIAADVA